MPSSRKSNNSADATIKELEYGMRLQRSTHRRQLEDMERLHSELDRRMWQLKAENEALKRRIDHLERTASGQSTYAIAFGDTFVKIGKAIDPKKRLTSLRSGKFLRPQGLDPKMAELVKVWPENIESKLHKKYADYRLVGEVFDLTAQPIKELVFS